MRTVFLSTLAVSTLALAACSMDGGGTASASSSAVQKATPDFAAAVAAEKRSADNVKLDESRQPAATLSFLGLKQGDVAIDLLAGGGYYSEIMSSAVGPAGKVTAHNVEIFVVGEKNKAKWDSVLAGHTNIELYVKPYHQFTAPAATYDFAMLHMIYHDAYWESEQPKFPRMEPVELLKSLYAAMKPNGIVGVVDHVADPGDTRDTVQKYHRIDPAVVKADFAKAGFVLEATSDLFKNPDDDHKKLVFDPSVRGKTDRFVMRFRKSG